MTGRFITFEGGEGAGKSTHVRLLAEALRGAGLGVVETREPGGSPGAEQIRELLVHGEVKRWDAMTEALLHFAATHPDLGLLGPGGRLQMVKLELIGFVLFSHVDSYLSLARSSVCSE